MAASALVLASSLPAHAATYVAISGSGSTWSQNALDQWRRNVASNYGMTVNFSGTGSSAGRADFIKGTVDFAVSEIPFQGAPEDGSAPERPERGYAYLPIVAGGTALMYNLEVSGKRVTDLKMSGEIVTNIFSGQITRWNDAAIQALNPGLALPDKEITPVVRSDGSGSTAQFTKWMSTQYPGIWSTGMTSQFPTSKLPVYKAQSGSLGVSGYVAQSYGVGSITYVEYSYAMKSGFPVVQVQNAAGNFVTPTAENVEIALRLARINEDQSSPDYLTQILNDVYTNPDPSAYPMSSYSYMIVPTQPGGVFTAEKGYTLGEFVRYVVCDGQKQAGALGYSPLPMNLVKAAFDQIKRIPGTAVGDFDENSCSNKGAAGEGGGTPGAGAGSDPAAAANAGAAVTPEAAAAAVTGADAVYDANGNLVSGSGGTGGAAAVSSPFTLASSVSGASQIGIWIAVGLLVLTLLVPPLVLRPRRRGR
jgi:phosphate transport system substrate-binding protein